MKYVVMTCRATYDLLLWAAPAYGVWSPVYARRTYAKGQTRKVNVCALPGYVFVPLYALKSLLRDKRATPGYALHTMRKPSGALHLVERGELHYMQDRVREYYAEAAPPVPVPFQEGDRVQFNCEPFRGYQGIVERVRKGTCRVLLGTTFVTVDRAYLLKVK